MRDALDLIAKRHPGLIVQFGGHAMAAGLTLKADGFEVFSEAFEAVAKDWLTQTQLERLVETDGSLDDDCFSPGFHPLCGCTGLGTRISASPVLR